MTTFLRRCAAGLIVALGFSLPASATTAGADFTDLWYNPAEDGWGINFIQQSNIIFATMFVYGTDNRAHWFVASDMRPSGNTFSGVLYETSGPAFNTTWNNAQVSKPPAGSIAVTFNTLNTATLTYTVGSSTVTKQIQRQTWAAENLSGLYLGGMTASASSCGNPADAGLVLIFDELTVTHSGNSFTAQVKFNNTNGVPSSCTYSGSYSQSGRLGAVSGNWNCTFGNNPGNHGNFSITQIDATQNGFNGVFSGSDQFCNSVTGYFGGVRDFPH